MAIRSLSSAQRAALRLFEPDEARRTHPDINPRTADALREKGLLTVLKVDGRRLFLLTGEGEVARGRLRQ